MKVGLICDFPPYSGMGRYSYEIFERLKGKNVEFVYFHEGEKLKENNVKNIKKLNFPVLRKTLNELFYCPKYIRNTNGYDIYHASNHLLAKIAKFANPSVITVMDLAAVLTNDFHFIIKHTQKRLLENMVYADRLIAISNSTKNHIIEYFGVPEDKIDVIYFGVNHKVFRPLDQSYCRNKLKLPKNKKIILNVASGLPRKNLETVFKAFYKLQKKRDDIILVRIGDHTQRLDKLIDELGIRNKIIHIKQVKDPNTLCFYYNSADVFVFPSFFEGFGLPPLEAMSCGSPVIVSTKTSLPEVVGEAGIKINPVNINELASSIENVIGNENLTAELSKKSITQARKFLWEKCARETYKVYRKVYKQY